MRKLLCGLCGLQKDKMVGNVCQWCLDRPIVKANLEHFLEEARLNVESDEIAEQEKQAVRAAKRAAADTNKPPKEERKRGRPPGMLSHLSESERNAVYRARRRAKTSGINKGKSWNPEVRRRIEEVRIRRFAEISVNDLTTAQWRFIVKAYGHCCAYCRIDGRLEQDHIVPISKGGGHTASNIIPACRSCNSSKRDRDVKEFFSCLQRSIKMEADAFTAVLTQTA